MISTAKRERKQRKATNEQPPAVDLVDVPRRRVEVSVIEPLDVPVDAITRSPYQVRQEFPDAEIRELAQTIANLGQLSPIIVRELADGYELVEGERRWRAVKLLGWETIRAEVHQLTDAQARAIVLVSAIQRKALNAIEEAMAFRQAIEAGDAPGPTELARQLGLSQGHVSNRLRLLELPEDWQRRIISGEIPATHARAALQLKAFPHLLTDLVQVFEDWKSWNGGTPTVDDFEDMVSQVARRNGRRIGDKHSGRYVSDLGKYVPPYKPTDEERQALEILTLGEGKEALEYATNVEFWEQLQKAHEEKWIAKQRGKAGGANPTKGSSSEPERLSPEEEARRAKEQERQAAKRLWSWYVEWQRYLVAKAILDDRQTSRADLERLLLYLAVDLRQTSDWHDLSQRQVFLSTVMRSMVFERRFKSADVLDAVLAIDSEIDDDLLSVLAKFLAACFFNRTGEGGGGGVPLPDADVLKLAGYLAVNPQRSWEAEQAGQHLSEDYWSLHTKDQLLALAKELGVEVKATSTKASLVEALHKPGEIAGFPKELAKIKRPK